MRHSHPVKPTDKNNYRYEIKTTGDSFSGNKEEMLKLIDEIKNMISK